MKQESCGIWSYCSYSHDAVSLTKVEVSPFSLIDRGREGGGERHTGQDGGRQKGKQAGRASDRNFGSVSIKRNKL